MELTVVISTYNGENYIEKQLDSIKNQTRPADEVLIIDDCSTDNTVNIIRRYIEKNDLYSWKFEVNNQNKGWRVNFFEGISASTGSLVFPCDQDDVWYPNKLEIMEKAMRENENIGVLVSELDEFFSDGEIKKHKTINSGNIRKISEKNNFINVEYPGCVYCVRKSFFSEIRPYWKPSFPHDAFLWRFAMFSGKLYVLKTATIMQRKHQNSTFTKEAKLSRSIHAQISGLDYVEETIENLEKYIVDLGYESQSKNIILKNARVWNKKRRRFLTTGSYFEWFSLAKYIGNYATPKKYFLDLYVVIKEKGKIHG